MWQWWWGADVGTEQEENKEVKKPPNGTIYLSFPLLCRASVKRSYESERPLTSAVMFWLESDSGKTLCRSAWLAYDKLKLSSIISHGSMKIDFLLHRKVSMGSFGCPVVLRDLDLEETLLYHL